MTTCPASILNEDPDPGDKINAAEPDLKKNHRFDLFIMIIYLPVYILSLVKKYSVHIS
jgi:hypothetical protein